MVAGLELDHDSENVEGIRRFGLEVFHGDATRLNLLRGFERHQARNLALRLRRHDLEPLAEMAPRFKDESKLIAMAKTGRAQMEQLMAGERRRKDSRARVAGWAESAARGDDAAPQAQPGRPS